MKTVVMKELERMSNEERLAVIETASRLIREDLAPMSAEESLTSRMAQAAEEAKAWYAAGGELTEWTVLDQEDFIDESESGRGLAG